MSSPIEQLAATLKCIHQQLEEDKLLDAAALMGRALQECVLAQSSGLTESQDAINAAMHLERQCSATAQRVIDRLVRSSRNTGTVERALRAYSEDAPGFGG